MESGSGARWSRTCGGFADELARQGYKVSGAKGQLFLVAHLSRWLADRGLDVSVLASPEVAEGFFAAHRTLGYTNYRTVKALAPLLVYLRGLAVPAVLQAAKVARETETTAALGTRMWRSVSSAA